MDVPSTPPIRTTVAIVVLVLCSLLSTGRMISNARRVENTRADDIYKRSDERFARLKARLPSQGIVGYIGGSGDSATPDYYLTQYALAPVVVDSSYDHALVVCNFPLSAPSGIPPHLKLIEDFGNGVMLFSGKDAQ